MAQDTEPALYTLYQLSQLPDGVGYQTLTAAYKAGTLKAAREIVTGPKRKVPLFTKAALEEYAQTSRAQTVGKAAKFLGLDPAQAAELRERFVATGKPNKITIG